MHHGRFSPRTLNRWHGLDGARRREGFTLLELLIVILIIGVLATMILSGLSAARRRAQVAVAKSNIQALKAALSMYESETGKFPRRGPATSASLFYNDIAYAYAALRNRPTQALMGGPNSPYIDWKPEQIGVPSPDVPSTWNTDPAFGSQNPGPISPYVWFTAIDPADDTNSVNWQTAHLPSTGSPATFLDPWGNPYVYFEWGSVPTTLKDSASLGGQSSLLTVGGTSQPMDRPMRPHDASKFDIYSFGPNGINEYGGGDDVTSWSDAARR